MAGRQSESVPKSGGGIRDWRADLDIAVAAIASTAGLRDAYTRSHQERTATLAAAIAQELARPEDEIRAIYLAGVLHDVGKIGIPNEILSKPARLSAIEYELIRGHVAAGYEIALSAQFPRPIAVMVAQHHERLDGSGYPEHAAGDDIIFGAKILGVADVTESMTSHRPYRAALGVDAAMAEIETNKGRLYDPQAVDACLALLRRGYRFE